MEIFTRTEWLNVDSISESWPGGILTYKARVRMPDGSLGTLKSVAKIYHGPRRTPELTLSPDDHTTTLFGSWQSLCLTKVGDDVEFAASGRCAEFLNSM